MAKFIVHKHEAKRKGLHWDIRFQMPNSKNWASFACMKEPPPPVGERWYIIRTNDHSEKEALFTGVIDDGYGAGKLSVFDKGSCKILKFSNAHIVVVFKGNKFKGKFHFVNTGVFGKTKGYGSKTYAFFKAKN